MAKRFEAVIVFRPGTTREQAEGALAYIMDMVPEVAREAEVRERDDAEGETR